MTGYRTIVFNLIMAALVAIRAGWPDLIVPSEADVNAFLNAVDAVFAAVMVIGNLVMRFVTKTPVGQQQPPL